MQPMRKMPGRSSEFCLRMRRKTARNYLAAARKRWEARPLRGGAARRRRGAAKSAGAFPGIECLVLHRASFGPAPGDSEYFRSLGGTDEARLEAWVDEQLSPESINDAEVDARIAASNFTTLNKSLNQLWVDHWLPEEIEWSERMRPFMETQAAVFLRAVYSKRQLVEVLLQLHDGVSVNLAIPPKPKTMDSRDVLSTVHRVDQIANRIFPFTDTEDIRVLDVGFRIDRGIDPAPDYRHVQGFFYFAGQKLGYTEIDRGKRHTDQMGSLPPEDTE